MCSGMGSSLNALAGADLKACAGCRAPSSSAFCRNVKRCDTVGGELIWGQIEVAKTGEGFKMEDLELFPLGVCVGREAAGRRKSTQGNDICGCYGKKVLFSFSGGGRKHARVRMLVTERQTCFSPSRSYLSPPPFTSAYFSVFLK